MIVGVVVIFVVVKDVFVLGGETLGVVVVDKVGTVIVSVSVKVCVDGRAGERVRVVRKANASVHESV